MPSDWLISSHQGAHSINVILNLPGSFINPKALWSGIKGVVRKEGGDRIEERVKIEEPVKTGEANGGLMEIKTVTIEKTDDLNMILGHSHFIKTVEDVYEAIVNTVPGAKFGMAFCEASGPCLVRYTGTDNDLIELAKKNAYNLSAGHSFIVFMKDMFPVNVLNAIKNVPEVCRIICATANPVEVLVVETELGRGIVGVIDGFRSKGIETQDDIKERKEFLRTIGYKQ
jgi:adenosine/AMP kinase